MNPSLTIRSATKEMSVHRQIGIRLLRKRRRCQADEATNALTLPLDHDDGPMIVLLV